MANVSLTPPAAPSAPASPAPSAPATPAPSAPAAPAPSGGGFGNFLQTYEQEQQGDAPVAPAPEAEPAAPAQFDAPVDDVEAAPPAGDDVPLTDEEWAAYEASLFTAPQQEDFDPAKLDLEQLAQEPERLRTVTERLLGERNSPALQLGQSLLEVAGDNPHLQAGLSQVVQDLLNPTGEFEQNGQQFTNAQRLGVYLNQNFPHAAQAVALDTLQYEPGFLQQHMSTIVERLAQEPAFNDQFVRRSEVEPYLNSDLQASTAELLQQLPAELHETFRALKPAVQKDMLARELDVAIDDLQVRKQNADARAASQHYQQQQQERQQQQQTFQALKSTHTAQLQIYDQLVADAKASGYSELEAQGIAAQSWRQIEAGYFDENSQWRNFTEQLQQAHLKGDTATVKKLTQQFRQATVPLYKQTLRKHVKPSTVRQQIRPKTAPPGQPPAGEDVNAPRFAPPTPPGGPRGRNGQPISFGEFIQQLPANYRE